MSLYTAYATTDDLATFLAIDEADLPSDAGRLLDRASELVCQAMWNNYNSANTEHVEAAMLATCAQVEYWIQVSETPAFTEGAKDLAIGSFKVSFGNAAGSSTGSLSQRSRAFLSRQGLLYRGV